MQSSSKKKEKNNPPLLRKQHTAGPLPECLHGASQYKEIKTCSYTLKLDQANSFVYIDGKVAKLQNIISARDDIYVAYTTFNNHELFFDYPLPSSALGIHLVDDISGPTHFCKFENIEAKAFLVPYDRYFVSVPLLHTQ